MVGQGDAERGNMPSRVDEGSLVGGKSRERIRRGRRHATLRTRKTSEWIEKDGRFFLSLPLSLTAYRSVLVPSDHFSHFHTPRGEAVEQSSMAGREPAYYAVKH